MISNRCTPDLVRTSPKSGEFSHAEMAASTPRFHLLKREVASILKNKGSLVEPDVDVLVTPLRPPSSQLPLRSSNTSRDRKGKFGAPNAPSESWHQY